MAHTRCSQQLGATMRSGIHPLEAEREYSLKRTAAAGPAILARHLTTLWTMAGTTRLCFLMGE
eukprot:3571195-Amphidinium_carterae.1